MHSMGLWHRTPGDIISERPGDFVGIRRCSIQTMSAISAGVLDRCLGLGLPYCRCDAFAESKRAQKSSQGSQVIGIPKFSPRHCVRGFFIDLGCPPRPVPL
jgi:hypothetical protein